MAQIFFCALAAAPVVATIVAFFLFAFLDRDRLQSEEYQLEHQRLQQGTKNQNYLSEEEPSHDHAPPLIAGDAAFEPDEPPAQMLVGGRGMEGAD